MRISLMISIMVFGSICLVAAEPPAATQPAEPAHHGPSVSEADAHRSATSKPAATSQPAAAAVVNEPTEYLYFNATTMEGDPVALPGDYSGRLLLVSFWATWCPVCSREQPFWKEAYAAYHDRGVEFIGMPTDKNRGRGRELVENYIRTKSIAWPQCYDEAPEIARQFHADVLPTSFLVDGDTGEVLAKAGAVRKKRLATQIEKYLRLKEQQEGGIAVSSAAATPLTSSQPTAAATSQPAEKQ